MEGDGLAGNTPFRKREGNHLGKLQTTEVVRQAQLTPVEQG